MDEFVEQFVIESREHVEQASSALLALGDHAGDPLALDALFRSVHTLKGSAGIIEFSAMERLLHALESDLGQLKSNNEAVSDELNARALACLDLISRWLDIMARSDELPLGAEADVSALFDRLEAAPAQKSAKATPTPSAAPDWLTPTLSRHEDLRSQAKTAVRYVPQAECFFRGDDPLAVIEQLPGVLTLDLEPLAKLPSLDELDPYESLLAYTVLSSATSQELTSYLKDQTSECEIVSLHAIARTNHHATLSPAARELLEVQLALLAHLRPETFAGVVASVGTTAANALMHCGLQTAAATIKQGLERSLAAKNPGDLRQEIERALSGETQPQTAASATHRPDISTRTLRVDAERIELLVRLVGELTVVKNAIGHLANVAQGASALALSLKDQQNVLDRITSDLQQAVLGIRILPLRTVLGRFPAVVREIASNLGKPAKLVIEGDDTEADKAIIELLFEPLLHVVRNAMDHGIESPDVRTERNKPAVATIAMRAARQGDRILIQVSDDGGGIDPERVRKVALKRGLISAERLTELSEAEVIDLVFAPGFSTASVVTELSGRGVGMDAVRSAVARIGGTVTIESRLGEGATVEFSLPFSAMMSDVMTVEAGGQTFGIPLDAVVETIRVPVASLSGVGAAQAIAHRNRTLPIFELTDLLQTPAPAQGTDETVIVVTSFAGHWGGIRVNKLGERLEVMLKPLDGFLAGIRGITGTTIMGDGRVLLVLDMGEILS